VIALTFGAHEGLLAMIGLVFVLLVIIGFLPDRATSRGNGAGGGSKSDCI
jgi:hypothetical protein